MSIVVDIVLVLAFATVLFFFTKHGLDRALLKIGKTWLSFACALFIGPKLTDLFERLFIRDAITGAVHNSLVDLIEHNPNGYNIAELFENLPEGFVNFLHGLGASLEALEAEFGSYTEASDTIISEMASRIATPCINVLSSIIGIFLGFIIPWLFMKWIAFEIEKDRLPFFRFFDHVGGFLVGVGVGYALVLGLSLLTRTIFQVSVAFDSSLNVMDIYNNSFVFKFLGEFDTFGAIQGLIQTLTVTVQNVVG